MKHRSLLVEAVVYATGLFCVPGLSIAADKPNVVLILADDLGWEDAGFTGSTFYEMPRIDALVGQGAFFCDAYAASQRDPARDRLKPAREEVVRLG